MTPERPPKPEAFLALLKEGWTSLHLDARHAGVLVPEPFRGEAHLVLQFGYDLPIPIPDLEVDDFGVRATLSFSRSSHLTRIPWAAVYAIACVDGRGVLYPEDVPQDVSVVTAPEAAEAPPSEVAAAAGEGAVRRLRSIPAHPEASLDAPVEVEEPLAAARRRRRPQLRLVK